MKKIKFEKFEELQSDMVQTVWSQRKVFELFRTIGQQWPTRLPQAYG